MNQQQRTERLLKLKSDSELAIFDAVNELEDKVNGIVEELKKEFGNAVSSLPDINKVLSAVKGVQGDPGEVGEKGDPGERGPQGPEGRQGPVGPRGQAGRDGRDGVDGIDGVDGNDGEDGLPGALGPMPKHEWMGTKLKFELPGGRWGKEVDLIGPPGQSGMVERVFNNGNPNIPLKNNGSLVTTKIYSLNFAGSGISSITNADGNVTINVSGGGSGTQVFGEIPSGSINDSNTTFTLAHTPVSGTLALYLNGQRFKENDDYTLSGSTITFTSAPLTGSNVLADYAY